jgi:hypothetical protein
MNPKPVDKIIPVGIIQKDHPTLNSPANNMMQRTGAIYPGSSRHGHARTIISLQIKPINA